LAAIFDASGVAEFHVGATGPKKLIANHQKFFKAHFSFFKRADRPLIQVFFCVRKMAIYLRKVAL